MSKPLICILGASGSGKSTICEELMTKYNLKQIPSYTTRKCRDEKDKLGHTFVTTKEFYKLKDNLCAYATTTGAEYGVTNKQIDNENYGLYIVDYTGLKYLWNNYKGSRQIISIFVDCPLVHRYERLHKRYQKLYAYMTATEKSLERIIHDAGEFNQAKENCDFVIDNSDYNFPQAMAKIVNYLTNNGVIKWEEFK